MVDPSISSSVGGTHRVVVVPVLAGCTFSGFADSDSEEAISPQLRSYALTLSLLPATSFKQLVSEVFPVAARRSCPALNHGLDLISGHPRLFEMLVREMSLTFALTYSFPEPVAASGWFHNWTVDWARYDKVIGECVARAMNTARTHLRRALDPSSTIVAVAASVLTGRTAELSERLEPEPAPEALRRMTRTPCRLTFGDLVASGILFQVSKSGYLSAASGSESTRTTVTAASTYTMPLAMLAWAVDAGVMIRGTAFLIDTGRMLAILQDAHGSAAGLAGKPFEDFVALYLVVRRNAERYLAALGVRTDRSFSDEYRDAFFSSDSLTFCAYPAMSSAWNGEMLVERSTCRYPDAGLPVNRGGERLLPGLLSGRSFVQNAAGASGPDGCIVKLDRHGEFSTFEHVQVRGFMAVPLTAAAVVEEVRKVASAFEGHDEYRLRSSRQVVVCISQGELNGHRSAEFREDVARSSRLPLPVIVICRELGFEKYFGIFMTHSALSRGELEYRPCLS